MAQSLTNYVKNNPVESALAVASIIPVVRIGRIAYQGGKTLLKQNTKNQYKVYRGENKGNYQWDTAGGKLKGRFYFGGENKTQNARHYAAGKGTSNILSARVYSITLPKKQYNIAKKIANRRAGSKLPDEVNIPKQYVGKQKLEVGQTLLAQGQGLRNKLISYKTQQKIKNIFK